MAEESTTLHLPKDMIESIVRDRLNVEIAQTLGGKEAFAERIIKSFLQLKTQVNYRDIPLIEKLARDVVEEELKAALKEWFRDNAAALRAELVRQLGTKKTQTAIAQSLIDTTLEAAGSKYRNFFRITYEQDKRDD